MKTIYVMALIATPMFMALSPMAAFAMPMVGDVVGTNPEDATKALETAGCTVSEFEAEDGKIEAMCVDAASGKAMEVMIDPKTGAVTEIKASDD